MSMEPLRSIIRDEMLQLLATAAIAFAMLGVTMGIDSYMVPLLSAAGNQTADYADIGTAMSAANSKLIDLGTGTAGALNSIGAASIGIGREASKSIFCNFLGVGFTLVNCSPLNAFRGSLTSAAFTTSVALADTYAQQYILSLARTYAFTFLIPLGLFLRCFKVSRQAGGALIAIGFGFYTVYPTVILATDALLHGSPPGVSNVPAPAECHPEEPNVDESLGQFNAYAGQITNFEMVRNLAYFVLVRVLFMSILNLIITLGFIRAFAHIIGSDIDVSGLARIS